MPSRLFHSLFVRKGRRVEYRRGGLRIADLPAIPKQVSRTVVDAATSEEMATTATEWLIPADLLKFDSGPPVRPERNDLIIDRPAGQPAACFAVAPASGDDVADYHDANRETWLVHAIETAVPDA